MTRLDGSVLAIATEVLTARAPLSRIGYMTDVSARREVEEER